MTDRGTADRIMARVANSIRAQRTRLMRTIGLTHDGERDTWEVFGYPRSIQIQSLYERYRRGGLEQRIIRAFPKATWQTPPDLTDDANRENETTFEQEVRQLDRDHSVWHMLERADRLSAIGRFGILLMGFDDNEEPRKELRKGTHKLIYLRPFSERSVSVAELDREPTSPRYGLPVRYKIETQGVDHRDQVHLTVHHSRVLHLTEYPEEDDVYGTPRLEAVYNRLLDIEKTAGSSAEAFWLNANAAIALSASADADLGPDDIKQMKDQAEEFQHQLRRILALQGVDVKQLQVQIAQPEQHLMSYLKLVAGTIGMPLRILIGNEQGELASSSDDDNWAAEIDSRRSNYAAPRIVRPFINKMIEVGVLSKPQGDEYEASWEQQDTLSAKDKSEIALNRSNVLRNYASTPIAETIVPAREFREQVLGLDPEPEGGFPEDVEPDDDGDIDPDIDDEA